MKKLIFITFCVVLFSCKEKNIYCINTIKSSFESSAFVKSDMDKIKDLFNRNGFDYTKFLFTKIQYDGEYHIRGEQIVNNLLVFTSDVIPK